MASTCMGRSSTFQSTLPLRGVTLCTGQLDKPTLISIHAPLAGSDSIDARGSADVIISIHAPLAGSDE